MANNIITDLGMEILKKAIKKAAGLTDDNINLTQALGQSLERPVKRDNTEIKGITMAQARLAISDTIKQYLDYAVENSWITQECREEIDEGVIASNCAVELEKVMGIFPNIRILY